MARCLLRVDVVHDAVAIFCSSLGLLSASYRLDFAGAMRAVFFAGGDADSIGAIVGSIIGAQIGVDALPTVWVQRVRHRDYLCHLADQLS